MPNYSYMCENYHVSTEIKAMGEPKKPLLTCSKCGGEAYRVFRVAMPSTSGYPYTSDAMGVGPDQITESAQGLLDAGIPTQFDAEGGLIVESNEHRNKVMGHLGLFDRDAGYSQRTHGSSAPDYFKNELEGIEPPTPAELMPEGV